MAKVLIIYYSRGGNVREMARSVQEGAASVPGAHVDCRPVQEVTPEDLLHADAIIMGSPVYYGTMASELKKLIDDSVAFHGSLVGKVGGAFASSGNVGGGNETTIMDILKVWLIHGMIVPGAAEGDHYGPVAIGRPDQRAANGCLHLGKMIAELAKRLHG